MKVGLPVGFNVGLNVGRNVGLFVGPFHQLALGFDVGLPVGVFGFTVNAYIALHHGPPNGLHSLLDGPYFVA